MDTVRSRISIRAAAFVATALFAAIALPLKSDRASAQGTPRACNSRDIVLAQLKQKFGEVPVAIGVTDGSLIEVLAAEDGMTWTIIVTSPQGKSCLIASGEAWRPLTPAPTGPSV